MRNTSPFRCLEVISFHIEYSHWSQTQTHECWHFALAGGPLIEVAWKQSKNDTTGSTGVNRVISRPLLETQALEVVELPGHEAQSSQGSTIFWETGKQLPKQAACSPPWWQQQAWRWPSFLFVTIALVAWVCLGPMWHSQGVAEEFVTRRIVITPSFLSPPLLQPGKDDGLRT